MPVAEERRDQGAGIQPGAADDGVAARQGGRVPGPRRRPGVLLRRKGPPAPLHLRGHLRREPLPHLQPLPHPRGQEHSPPRHLPNQTQLRRDS